MTRLNPMACAVLLLVLVVGASAAQTSPPPDSLKDSDGDLLTDSFEQAILQRFQPQFLVSNNDCSNAPIAFAPDSSNPIPLPHTEGTIYGQVFPAKGVGSTNLIEVHYYHLWGRDCGRQGHPLDAEHVSALLRGDNNVTIATAWKALYWYSAAHEATVCDSSRIYSASSLKAEETGPRVWISQGKHASYLNPEECSRGCGADRCGDVSALAASHVINIGEPGHVMNGAIWTKATSWQLTAKMQSDFARADLDLLSAGQESSIPVRSRQVPGFQKAVAIGSEPMQAVSDSTQRTGMAVNIANNETGGAIQTSTRHVRRSLRRAFTDTIHFIQSR